MGNSESSERTLREFGKIESTDPKLTKTEMRLIRADQKMHKEEILDRFLKEANKNDVLKCVNLITEGMDASCMKAMATAINPKSLVYCWTCGSAHRRHFRYSLQHYIPRSGNTSNSILIGRLMIRVSIVDTVRLGMPPLH